MILLSSVSPAPLKLVLTVVFFLVFLRNFNSFAVGSGVRPINMARPPEPLFRQVVIRRNSGTKMYLKELYHGSVQ